MEGENFRALNQRVKMMWERAVRGAMFEEDLEDGAKPGPVPCVENPQVLLNTLMLSQSKVCGVKQWLHRRTGCFACCLSVFLVCNGGVQDIANI